jgi:hypothetical protein
MLFPPPAFNFIPSNPSEQQHDTLSSFKLTKASSLLRLLLGIVIAGMWPGMAYYLTLFYPPSRTGKRIGQYYTAAQLSAAVVGLVSAGFQKMDGARGLVGFQWMFLVYGVITVAVGIALLWWLPDRPKPPAGVEQGQEEAQEGEGDGRGGEGGSKNKLTKYLPFRLPQSRPVLTGRDAEIHYRDLTRVYKRPRWTVRNLLAVLLDWRLWPLLIMYFGVVGVGIGVQNYATVIIHSINPSLSGISLSLLTAPIWLVCFPFAFIFYTSPHLTCGNFSLELY